MTNKNKCVTELTKHRHSNLLLAHSAAYGVAFRKRVEIWFGDITSDERAVNGPVLAERVQKGDRKALTYW